MKEALTSFDIRVLLRELSELRGAYLDKVYQRNSSFILRFNIPRRGRKELYVKPGRWMFLAEEMEKPATPPPFAQGLRRSLDNAYLEAVEQRGFDRIVLFLFRKDGGYTLVLEMFGAGNLILLRNGEILQALKSGRWRTREIRRGRAYTFPPEGVNPLTLTLNEFQGLLRSYEGPVVKALASGMSLGGLYAEEVCLRAGVGRGVDTGELADSDITSLYEGLQSLLSQLDKPSPAVILEGEPVDVVPFDLRLYSEHEKVRFGTMSEALARYVGSLAEEEEGDEGAVRIRRRIARQEEVLRETEEEVDFLSRATDYLYAHYQDVARTLRLAQEGTLTEGVNPERGTITLTLDDGPLDLYYAEDVDSNARRLYARRKELDQRLERVRMAIEESKRELERLRTQPRKVEPPRYRPSKRFWFDAYRWSLTSEGHLILAGRGAKTNEKLVRKHLDPGDRYIHADLPGAPSVVLKEGATASEQSLREACRLAVAYSKAWKHGLGSSSAYWVTPEQVSKTAESGEYLRTGSFVVRGKRNYFHDLPLALGIGRVVYKGAEKIIAADPEAMEKLSEAYVVAKPGGKVDRGLLARKLSEAFEVPVDEVERLLPAGSFHISKVKGVHLELLEE